MKKIAVFFIVLISLMVIAGCNQSQKTVTTFSPDEDKETKTEDVAKTTITKVEDGQKSEPAPIKITTAPKTAQKETVDMPFAVIYPNTDTTESKKGYHLIHGTTPKDTDKILVNGIAVTKYKSGSTKWNYIAAASLGTLIKGVNNFTVSAVDKDGKELGSKSFSIDYKGMEKGALINTGYESTLISLVITFLGIIGIMVFKPSLIRIKK